MVSLREKQEALTFLPQGFLKLPQVGFSLDDVTSVQTPKYNCIAYAAKDESQRWWPLPYELGGRNYFWPDDLPREHPATVENFFKAFEKQGFKRCSHGRHEWGYEKVAIYVDAAGVPTHMARELGDGVWHSKLGKWHDIRHYVLEAVERPDYGTAEYFMRKPLEGYPRWKRIGAKLLRILSGSRTSQRI